MAYGVTDIMNTLRNLKKQYGMSCTEFSNIGSKFSDIDMVYKKKKSEINENFVEMENSWDLELIRIRSSNNLADDLLKNKSTDLLTNEFTDVIKSASKKLETIKSDMIKLEKEIKNTINEIPDTQEVSSMLQPAKVSPYILMFRQNKFPFYLTIMTTLDRQKCNGCQTIISIDTPYLKHIEEYPVNSNRKQPHSYHISRECLYKRGFMDDYLDKIPVFIDSEIENVSSMLMDIGFKNIHENQNAANFTEDIPDNASEVSDTSTDLMEETKKHWVDFNYFLRQPNEFKIKKLMCSGCSNDILTYAFLSFAIPKSRSRLYHLSDTCLKLDNVLPADMQLARCYVNNRLQNHKDLLNVIACGFHFNRIIGVKPKNPKFIPKDMKKPIVQPRSQSQLQHGFSALVPPPSGEQHQHHIGGAAGDNSKSYIFNEEPFEYRRLEHGNLCQGCLRKIGKMEPCMVHRERVPRPKLTNRLSEIPLVKQYYHVSAVCLRQRGFTPAYLTDFISCHMYLADCDNYSNVLGIVEACGFTKIERPSLENDMATKMTIASPIYHLLQQQQLVPQSPSFYITQRPQHGHICAGCGGPIAPHQACLYYGIDPQKADCLYHINKNCLNTHFTAAMIRTTQCFRDCDCNINPNELINCGISKISENLSQKPTFQSVPTSINPNKPKKHANKGPNIPNISAKTVATTSNNRLEFDVVLCNGNKASCHGCGGHLNIDKYYLRTRLGESTCPNWVDLHIDLRCFKAAKIRADRVATCKLSFSVQVSPEVVEKLRQCGFGHLPSVN